MAQATKRGGEDFPLDNLTFNLITIMHKKSKAIEAYDKYLEDAQADEEIRELIEEIRSQDEDFVLQLQQHLTRLLTEQPEAGGETTRNVSKTNTAKAGSTSSAARSASAGKGGVSGGRSK